jgi:peptidoglycan hydrolase CwlO-like protein
MAATRKRYAPHPMISCHPRQHGFLEFSCYALLVLFLATFAVIFSVPEAFAETYKCKINGAISYSDKPCSENPQPLLIPEYKAPDDKMGKPPLSEKEKYHQINSKLEAARKKRALQRQVESLKLQIEETQQARTGALKEIKESLDEIDFESDDIDDDIIAEDLEQELKAELKKTDNTFANKLEALETELDSLQQLIKKMTPDK